MTTPATEVDDSQQAAKSGILDKVAGYVVAAINDADEQDAAVRVQELRQRMPAAATDELAEVLIRHKCRQAGAIGAVTSGASIIPGLGTVAALTFGVAADIGLTFKLQAELVLEMAAAYEHPLSQAEKQRVVMLITGISAGANQVLNKVGREIAESATERLASKSLAKAIPVLGVAASAGTNVASTYVIGRRAQAYFSQGEAVIGNWADSMRAITGVDERRLTGWLAETTQESWQLVSERAQDATGVVITAGKSLGELAVVSANRTGAAVAGASQSVWRRLRAAPGKVWHGVRSMAAGIGRLLTAPFRWLRRRRQTKDSPPVSSGSG